MLGLPLILISIAFIYLVARGYKGLGSLKNAKRAKMAKLSIALGVLATLLCPIVAYLASTHIDSYQAASGRCPDTYPYMWGIISIAVIGIISFGSGAIVAWQGKQTKTGYMIVACALILGGTAAMAWFLSVYCLTF